MSNNIKLFDYGNNGVRIVEIDDNPWFVAKDVCEILGYSNSRKAVDDHLDDDEKADVTICDIRSKHQQNRHMIVISESGLYALILQSKKPEAKKFRKWVTSEVIPSIRTKGKYGLRPVDFDAVNSTATPEEFPARASVQYPTANQYYDVEEKQIALPAAEQPVDMFQIKEYVTNKQYSCTVEIFGKKHGELYLEKRTITMIREAVNHLLSLIEGQ